MAETRKALTLSLDDTDRIELAPILMEDDAEAAFAFHKRHFKHKIRGPSRVIERSCSRCPVRAPDRCPHHR